MTGATAGRRGLLATLLATSFMTALASLALAPAFGPLAADYGLSPRDVTWVFTIYVLANLAGLPLMSRLSDIYGRRPVFLANIVLFCLGSGLAAAAPSFGWLLAARALQAFGGASVSPVTSAIIGDVFPRERQGFLLALTGTMWAVAGLLGPAVGGVVVQNLGWPWVFALNVPFGAIALVLAWRFVPSISGPPRGKLDVPGLVLLTGAVVSLSYGLSRIDGQAPRWGLDDWTSGGLIALGLGLLVPWIVVESRSRHPLIHVALLRRRQLVLVNVISWAGGFMMAAVVLIPAYATALLGVDLQVAALLAGVPALVQFGGTPLAGWLVDRRGSRLVLTGAALCTVAGMLMLATVARDAATLIGGLAVMGLGFSAVLGGPLRYIVIGETTPAERGIANAIIGITSSIGSAIGFAVSGAILASFVAPLDGFRAAYVSFALAGGIALLSTLFLKARAAERAVPADIAR